MRTNVKFISFQDDVNASMQP